jgi:tRNA nucleotidyltransferase (CCA-adding enzyme)
MQLLETAVQIAARHGTPIYLVGGPVRDLFLEQPIADIDLVVEGDAWVIAEAFHAVVGGKLTQHAAFRTAAVALDVQGSPLTIDFVTARREIYPTPAALPEITPSHIGDDLQRRDFTINTLALRLDLAKVLLLDPFAGLDDIRDGVVRVLHDESLYDDPTRILRGARFAARLHFAVEPHTRTLIGDALDAEMIVRTSAQRILHEIWLLLSEPQPEAALALLHEWGALPQLALVWHACWPTQFPAARSARWPDTPLQLLYFGLLIWPLNATQRAAFTTRYNLPSAERKLIQELPIAPPLALDQPSLAAVELEQVLQRYNTAVLRVLQLVAPPVAAAQIMRYITTIRPLPALLSGDDLRARGIPPGPIYREVLHELRQAQLSGIITSHEDALGWLDRRFA